MPFTPIPFASDSPAGIFAGQPSNLLPYPTSGIFDPYDTFEDFPTVGDAKVLYLARNAGGTPAIYEWNGSAYVQVGGSGGSFDPSSDPNFENGLQFGGMAGQLNSDGSANFAGGNFTVSVGGSLAVGTGGNTEITSEYIYCLGGLYTDNSGLNADGSIYGLNNSFQVDIYGNVYATSFNIQGGGAVIYDNGNASFANGAVTFGGYGEIIASTIYLQSAGTTVSGHGFSIDGSGLASFVSGAVTIDLYGAVKVGMLGFGGSNSLYEDGGLQYGSDTVAMQSWVTDWVANTNGINNGNDAVFGTVQITNAISSYSSYWGIGYDGSATFAGGVVSIDNNGVLAINNALAEETVTLDHTITMVVGGITVKIPCALA